MKNHNQICLAFGPIVSPRATWARYYARTKEILVYTKRESMLQYMQLKALDKIKLVLI